MPVQVGLPAPRFKAQAYLRGTEEIREIALEDYTGRWVCLFFYPADFSDVCPTEVVGFDKQIAQFEQRKCQILGCSCDTIHAHRGWCDATPELDGLRYPLIADVIKRLAMDYGVLVPDKGIALRGTFLIDPQGVLRWSAVYDLSIGRSTDEVLRVLDALQTEALCPCNWQKGEKTLSQT